ncbi:MAG: PD-(D/E)XK nuclease family protein, partial [Clostridia bacterium]|nr:PD-(D/E)XK nuclease family protein [Clostridia bacterium]
ALGAERELSAAGLYYMHISELNTVSGDEERDDRELMKQMRLSGPTLGDDGLITAGDGTAFTRSSLVIAGLSFNKTEGFFKGASLVTGEEMAKTIGYAKQVGIKTLDSIMQGRAEVSPSKAGSHVACAYCPYLSICRFDTTAGSRYRRIRAVSADQFYNRKEKSK